MKKITLFFTLFVVIEGYAQQVVLNAKSSGSAYATINSVLAPGFDVCEPPDCAHPAFGPHIKQVYDSNLKKYVFEFFIHATPDSDCCNGDTTCQRNEIKTYDKSPKHLIGYYGDTVRYKWRFFTPAGFKPTPYFTHIHQVQPIGGDDAEPLFSLTVRKGNPNLIEIIHDNKIKLRAPYLSKFENTWVEVEELIKIDSVNGLYSISITSVETGDTITNYSNSKIKTIRSNNDFIHPKWGIYRSLNAKTDLKDETLRFSDIEIEKMQVRTLPPAILRPFEAVVDFNVFQQNQTISVTYTLPHLAFIQIELLSVEGKPIKVIRKFSHANEKEEVTLPSEELKPGVYLIRLTTPTQRRMEKVVVP